MQLSLATSVVTLSVLFVRSKKYTCRQRGGRFHQLTLCCVRGHALDFQRLQTEYFEPGAPPAAAPSGYIEFEPPQLVSKLRPLQLVDAQGGRLVTLGGRLIRRLTFSAFRTTMFLRFGFSVAFGTMFRMSKKSTVPKAALVFFYHRHDPDRRESHLWCGSSGSCPDVAAIVCRRA